LPNLVVIWLILHFADTLHRIVNPAVSKAFGKVMSLFLAAIAVAMLRSGILAFVDAASKQ
jgi:small neutral amino acid transporter SnatA (MarC family)